MTLVKISPALVLLLAGLVLAQKQNPTPNDNSNVILQNNRPKNEKESDTRTIDGTVKDASDSPLADAIVQLKNTKTSSIVDFATKDDGKFVFKDLPMDINFELLAKRGDLTTPVKKVSVYDTRKHVILNFQLAASKP
ncbi:MAG: carboxypeptidase-like regulatory domain-containing protein [Bryobacteraceae bacterium]